MPGISILEIISIITAFQLLMLGFVLLIKKSQQKNSNAILSMFMFSNAILLIIFVLSLLDIFNLSDIALFYFLLGPLLYLYVLSLCKKDFRLKVRHGLHGALFVLMAVYTAFVMVARNNGQTDSFLYSHQFVISDAFLHAQILGYIIASYLVVRNYRTMIKDHYSTIRQIDLTWLLVILGAFSAMWLTDLAGYFIVVFDLGNGTAFRNLLIVSISINFLFATYMVYRGLGQPDAFSGIRNPDKYSGSNISDEDIRVLSSELKAFMEMNKPFLNPQLSIRDLSEELKTNSKYLSQVINSEFSKNFYDFINHYRIREAQRIMQDNPDKKMTILEILYEVGFNSKSAFNTAFKKSTGKTPSDYKKLISFEN